MTLDDLGVRLTCHTTRDMAATEFEQRCRDVIDRIRDVQVAKVKVAAEASA